MGSISDPPQESVAFRLYLDNPSISLLLMLAILLKYHKPRSRAMKSMMSNPFQYKMGLLTQKWVLETSKAYVLLVTKNFKGVLAISVIYILTYRSIT